MQSAVARTFIISLFLGVSFLAAGGDDDLQKQLNHERNLRTVTSFMRDFFDCKLHGREPQCCEALQCAGSFSSKFLADPHNREQIAQRLGIPTELLEQTIYSCGSEPYNGIGSLDETNEKIGHIVGRTRQVYPDTNSESSCCNRVLRAFKFNISQLRKNTKK